MDYYYRLENMARSRAFHEKEIAIPKRKFCDPIQCSTIAASMKKTKQNKTKKK